MSGGFGYLNAPPALFPSSSNPSWLAFSDVRGLGVLDAVGFAAAGYCYIVMVWTSNLEQLRCFALYGAHRGRAAPGRLTLPDGRGLSTPDAAAVAVVDASPRHLAGMRLSGGFGYFNAPPALFPSSGFPSWARSFGCSWALSPRRRSFGCGGKLLYRHGTVRQSRALLPRALRLSSWSSGAGSPYSS